MTLFNLLVCVWLSPVGTFTSGTRSDVPCWPGEKLDGQKCNGQDFTTTPAIPKAFASGCKQWVRVNQSKNYTIPLPLLTSFTVVPQSVSARLNQQCVVWIKTHAKEHLVIESTKTEIPEKFFVFPQAFKDYWSSGSWPDQDPPILVITTPQVCDVYRDASRLKVHWKVPQCYNTTHPQQTGVRTGIRIPAISVHTTMQQSPSMANTKGNTSQSCDCSAIRDAVLGPLLTTTLILLAALCALAFMYLEKTKACREVQDRLLALQKRTRSTCSTKVANRTDSTPPLQKPPVIVTDGGSEYLEPRNTSGARQEFDTAGADHGDNCYQEPQEAVESSLGNGKVSSISIGDAVARYSIPEPRVAEARPMSCETETSPDSAGGARVGYPDEADVKRYITKQTARGGGRLSDKPYGERKITKSYSHIPNVYDKLFQGKRTRRLSNACARSGGSGCVEYTEPLPFNGNIGGNRSKGRKRALMPRSKSLPKTLPKAGESGRMFADRVAVQAGNKETRSRPPGADAQQVVVRGRTTSVYAEPADSVKRVGCIDESDTSSPIYACIDIPITGSSKSNIA